MGQKKGVRACLRIVSFLLLLARAGSAQGNLTYPCSAPEIAPSEQAKYLAVHPNDLERIKCMLDFYARRLQQPDLGPYRMALIRWVIAHHPDISLEGHLDQGLDVGTESGADYSQIRELWRQQTRRLPENPTVLSNAGRSLSISDREEARRWLRHALRLSPQDWTISKRLADLYAYAIIGLAGTGPDLAPILVDAEEQSSFAKLALQDAQEDSNIAALTGMRLHYLSQWPFFRTHQLDYDRLAETLLLKAASLDYPRPTKISALKDFYFDQQNKAIGRIDCEALTVEMPADEMMKRLTTPELLGGGYGWPLLPVRVKIVVGVDGHVWSASPIETSTKQSSLTAAHKAMDLSFLPLMVDGKPARVSTELTLKVEDFEGSAIVPVSN